MMAEFNLALAFMVVYLSCCLILFKVIMVIKAYVSGSVEVFHETWNSCGNATVFAGEPGTVGNRPDELLWTVQNGLDPTRGIITNGSNIEYANSSGAWYYLRQMDCSGDSTYVDYTFKFTLPVPMTVADSMFVEIFSTDKSMKSAKAQFWGNETANWNGNADGAPDFTKGVEFTLQIRLDYVTHEATFYIDGTLQGGPYAWPDSVGAFENQVRIQIQEWSDAGDDHVLLDDVICGSGLW